MDHLPTSQLFEERNLLQLLAERNVQALRAQGAVGLEVHWAHFELRSNSGQERSSVTGNKFPEAPDFYQHMYTFAMKNSRWSICAQRVGDM